MQNHYLIFLVGLFFLSAMFLFSVLFEKESTPVWLRLILFVIILVYINFLWVVEVKPFVGGGAVPLLLLNILPSVMSWKWLFPKSKLKRRMNEVANTGSLAFQNGLSIDHNPHPADSDDHDFWRRGYELAKRRKEQASQ